MHYAVVIERDPAGFGGYVPDLPGCIAAAESAAEVRTLIREAIGFHLEALREDGAEIPPPATMVEYVEVASAA